MKASEFIKEYGDFEITDDIKKNIPLRPRSVWELKEGDKCYYISLSNDSYFEITWHNSQEEINKRKYGFIVLTEEEAAFKSNKTKVYEELKRFAKNFTDEDWRDEQIEKYFIYFNFYTNEIEIGINRTFRESPLYFESKAKVENAIYEVGEDMIKKYYLEINSETKGE